MSSDHKFRLASVLASLLCVSISLSAHAQVDESALKAAYIFNFTEFTTWPKGSLSDGAFYVCANRDSDLGAALLKLDGRTVSGRRWSIRDMPMNSGEDKCNVIVLEGNERRSNAVRDLLSSDQAVLVIGDTEDTDDSAVIRLFMDENHLRFDVENQQALRRHLSLSSKLLRLARNVL